MEPCDLPRRCRAALVIAHPGHELRVHRWLRLERPTVFVLTDGSGRAGASRLGSTLKVLEAAGARPGSICGRLTDRAMYAAVLSHRHALFFDLAAELADRLARGGFERVAGDAAEGFNPAHDVCRLLIDTAVLMARRATGRPLANFDFLLDGDPADCPPAQRERAIRLRLDDDDLAAKLDAARAYPGLGGEVEAALRAHGADAFRTECLRPVDDAAPADARRGDAGAPSYEGTGAQRVAGGHYLTVLRRREHVEPLAAALRHHAG